MWSLVKRALNAIGLPLWTEGQTAALGASGQSYCVWCFLYTKSKSPTFTYSPTDKMYPRAAICLRLYIGNVIHVDVYLLIFDISQPFPCCHVEPPKDWPPASLRLYVGSRIDSFTTQQIYIGHSRMWRQ